MFYLYSKAVQTFLRLKDTIASYTGLAGKHLKVNSTEDGIDTSTDTDSDIHDAVSKKHSQNTDTKLQDGASLDSVVVNAGGIVDFPKQSGCRVYQSASSQAVGSGVEDKVVLDAENWDVQNQFDSVTNYRWTATKAGKVLAIMSISWTGFNDGGYTYVDIKKNGAVVSNNDTRVGSSGPILLKHLDEIDVVAGDYIEFGVYNGDSVSRNLNNASTHTFAVIQKEN